MNEADIDKDYEAAVLQLERSHKSNVLKFWAIMMLFGIGLGFIAALVLSVGPAVRAVMGV